MIDGGGYAWTNTKGSLKQMPNPSGGSYASGVGNSVDGAARITLLAATNINVTYNNNEGTGCNTKNVNVGAAYGELCVPMREGYRFDGWYTAIKGGTEITSSTIVSMTYDHTIYAHWTKAINPIISFGTNGNSGYVKGNVASTINVSNGNAELDISTFKYIYSTSNSATPNTSFTSGNSYTLENATGTYYLIAKACDVDGKCTTEVSNPFYVDNTAPSGTISISFNSGTLKGTVSATDIGSGVSSYMYALTTNSTCPTSGYIESTNNNYSFTITNVGTYYICAKVKDRAGNISEPIMSSSYILGSQVIAFGNNGNSGYVNGNISSTIIVSRGGAELNTSTYKYIYSTNSSAIPDISFTSGNSYTLTDATGTYYLIARACDVNGECSTKVSNPFYVDNTAPTCSLSVSGTTITGTYSDTGGSEVAYYGWNSSMTGTSSATKTIDSTGTHTFYVKDGAGNSTSCRITVTSTDHDDGYDYVGAGTSYGWCTCQKRGSSTTTEVTCGTSCSCPSGYYAKETGNCGVKRTCSPGWNLTGTTCYKWRGINYYCNSGYTKINDSYCYKIN